MQKWELRFFVVLRGKLQWFKSRDEYHSGKQKPAGTVDLRHSSIWPVEGEAEVEADRIHKFVVTSAERTLFLCAETEEIMHEWVTGVAAVISLSMRAFSIEEVCGWLGINKLSGLVISFRDNFIDGRRLIEMDNMDALPPQLGGSTEDLATLVFRMAVVNGSDGGNSSPKSPSSPVDGFNGSLGSGYDCVLIHKAGEEALVDAMIAALPEPDDGLGPWKIFRSNLEAAVNQTTAATEEHLGIVMSTPNVLVLCTSGFFRREVDESGRELLSPRLEIVAKALELTSTNLMCIYTSDFKIPKPNLLPENLRPCLKLDFYKLDLEIEEVSKACTTRICGDFLSSRKPASQSLGADQSGGGGGGGRDTDSWNNAQQAVFASTETSDPAERLRCFAALTGYSATLDGERQFYEWHGVEAAARALGCSVIRAKGGTIIAQDSPVCDKELIRLILVNFLLATFNTNDQKSRAAVIGFEGGIHALVGSLLKMQESETAPGSSVQEEEALLFLALQLCGRLVQNDANMRSMRTTGTVKMARRCLSSNNRGLRTLAESTINRILNLADVG
jgi:hypothetical protein